MKAYICGVEVEADFLNPDVAEKYEACVESVGTGIQKAGKSKKMSEGIRMQCDLVIHCLDDMFGEGSAKKILGESTDLLACLDAFEDFCSVYEKYVNPVLSEKAMAAKARAAMRGA